MLYNLVILLCTMNQPCDEGHATKVLSYNTPCDIVSCHMMASDRTKDKPPPPGEYYKYVFNRVGPPPKN